MIISNSRRFLFIHVPKAAGTSVTRELSRFTTFRDIEVGGTRFGEKLQDMYAARFDLRKHSTAKIIRAKAGPEVWRGFFVFAFVRNPYARAYSLYRFIQKWRDGPHHAEVASMSFEDFATSPALAEGRIDIALPQTHWLTDVEGRVMDGIDFVGRLESFDEDMSFILSTIQRRVCDYRAVERANVSAEPEEWRAAMTPNASAAIRVVYAEDFRTFGYHAEDLGIAA
ncbi:MAG: sulfotransferase family 2 domain-containing protein [Pseudomonadota bacterium]